MNGASKELRFQFRQWTDYAFGLRLQEVWNSNPALHQQYRDFRAFMTDTKKQAGAAAFAAREKASRDAARIQAKNADRGTVGLFISQQLAKHSRAVDRSAVGRTFFSQNEGSQNSIAGGFEPAPSFDGAKPSNSATSKLGRLPRLPFKRG